mmetsp:Transcript_69641/g.201908  ORF Transcript_69641/g.201908 Transcript_69641/m.201908 type:complete len:607 (+) Transcript_69641:76-1896(+)
MGTSPYRPRFIGGAAGSGEDDVGGAAGEKYFGLVNVKNTCYVNSVVQALYFCTPFRRRAIRHLAEAKDDEPGGESLLTSLAELFAQIENQKRNVGCLTPRRFLTRLRKANDLFCNSEHQDAHEFLQFLLNDIMEQAKKCAKRQRDRERLKAIESTGEGPAANGAVAPTPSTQEDEEELRTWVHDILQGYLVNQMKCLCCENVTVRREAFFDLSVDIEQHTSIAACLRAFESTERLRASNKFFCDTCGCLQEAEKRLRIYQLPSVLTLHLKRFKYVERLGRCCRLPYRVVFPLQLRVVEHKARPKRRSASKNDPKNGLSSGRWRDGRSPADVAEDAPLTAEAPPPTRLFELRSVVVHIGRDSSYGHYVTVVRNGDRCVLLDDDVVRVVEPEILRSFYGTAGNGFHGGGNGQERPGNGGWSGDHEGRGGHGHSHHHHNNHHGGSDRHSGHAPAAPYYERAPEGTCCGYLLIYELVDGGTAEGDSGGASNVSSIDLASATDWISEERNLSDSDSGGESTEERPGGTLPPSRRHPNVPADDSELTQAFEQRCIPSPSGASQAWRAPGSTPPAAGPGTDTISLSRVNVSTVNSPAGSLEGMLTSNDLDGGL